MAVFRKKFRFHSDQLEYDFRLKRKFPWWWLLLLLIPLVLLIPFGKDVDVKVVDKAGAPVEATQVNLSYNEFTPGVKFRNPVRMVRETQVTDVDGMASFGRMRFSLFSLLFHPKEKVDLQAEKGTRTGGRSVRLHWFTKIPVVVVLNYPPFQMQFMSLGEDLPIPGAHADLTLSNGKTLSLTADADGKASFPVDEPGLVIESLQAVAAGYVDKEEKDIAVEDWEGKVFPVWMFYRIDSVDIVLCIDGTGSMRTSLSAIRAGAADLHTSLQNHCRSNGKLIDTFRIRLICFGDYGCDGNSALTSTDFFTIPGEEREYQSAFDDLRLPGGGDTPESGLEALSVTLDSPWSKVGSGRRSQVIVLWTNAPAHPIRTVGTSNPIYPAHVPNDLDGLKAKWQNGATDSDGKWIRHLILIAPSSTPWLEISTDWDGVLFSLFDNSAYTDLEPMMESIAKAM